MHKSARGSTEPDADFDAFVKLKVERKWLYSFEPCLTTFVFLWPIVKASAFPDFKTITYQLMVIQPFPPGRPFVELLGAPIPPTAPCPIPPCRPGVAYSRTTLG